MEKRVRSPNYPALSLPDAIGRVANLHRELHGHSAPREDIAKAMGFNTLNGASATAISALHKYGLIEGGGDNIKVSDRALRILHPHSPEEKAEAIQEAASEPQLFNDLAERFPGGLNNEALVRNYLIRAGFAPSAVPAVITAYRETSEMVDREQRTHDSPREQTREHDNMPDPQNRLREPSPAHEQMVLAATPGEPFRVSFTPSGIEITAKLTDAELADKVIDAIQALKGFLPKPSTSASQIERPEADPLAHADDVSARTSVSLLITQAQKEQLRERGFTDEQIRDMKPEEAHRVLGLIN
jgi:hypothetical protein